MIYDLINRRNMPLIRAQKETLVTKLLEELKASRVAVVFSYTKLNNDANTTLRDKAFEQAGKIKMISNSLFSLILKQLGRELDVPAKQLAVAYGFEDEVSAAKLLVEFGKETETLEVIGGWVDGSFYAAADVKALAALPSKENLQAQVVGRLAGVINQFVYNLNFPLAQLVYVIEAVKKSKE